jgi:DNA polymerase III sliding clamp (beta) subunit (PCNA family)
MNNLEFVKLAVSKDKSRYNLTDVFRAPQALVATDSHRLHYSNGLPESTPHYISGDNDRDFPIDIDAVSTVLTIANPLVTVQANASQVVALTKTLTFLVKAMGKTRRAVNLKIAENCLTISYDAGSEAEIGMQWSSSIKVEANGEGQVNLNPVYLLDALKMASVNNSNDPLKITLGEGVILLERSELKAVLMGMKANS